MFTKLSQVLIHPLRSLYGPIFQSNGVKAHLHIFNVAHYGGLQCDIQSLVVSIYEGGCPAILHHQQRVFRMHVRAERKVLL